MTLQEKLCRLRGREGLSQEDVAEKLNVSRQSVSKWETGQSVPELEKLLALSELYHVSLDDLAREERDPFERQASAETVTRPVYAPAMQRTLKQTRQLRGLVVLLIGLGMFFLSLLFLLLNGNGTLAVVGFYGGIGIAIIGGALMLFHRVHPLLVIGWAIMFGLVLFDQFCGWSWRVLLPHYSADHLESWWYTRYFPYAFYGFQLPYLFVLTVLTAFYAWEKWRKKRRSE